MSDIKPALTAEQWTSGRHGEPGTLSLGGQGNLNLEVERSRDLFMGHIADGLGMRVGGKDGAVAALDGRDAHALAALCLYQQPFGFTRQDVRDIGASASNASNMASDLLRDADWIAEGLGASFDAAKFSASIVALDDIASRLHNLAARIAALLPPNDK